MRYLLLALLLISCGRTENVTETPGIPDDIANRIVWEATALHIYRIPTLVVAGNKLIAFAEKRKGSSSDRNDTSIVVKQLDPAPQGLIDLGEIDMGPKILSNPQPIYDNGVLHLFFSQRPSGTASAEICATANLMKIFHTISVDDGLTWEAPEDITAGMYNATSARNLIISPTTGVAKDGTLYVTAYNRGQEADCAMPTHMQDISMVLRFDQVWRLHTNAANQTNENVYDLEHDTFWARNYSPDSTRRLQVGATSFFFEPTMPHVHSGMIIHNDETYVSYPFSDLRENLVFQKFGKLPFVIYRGPSAYSNIAYYKGNYAVIYEAGENSPYEKINVKFLKETDL